MKPSFRREKLTEISHPLEGRSAVCVRFHRCGCATEHGPDRKCKRPILHSGRMSGLSLKFQRGTAGTDATSCRSEPVGHVAWCREQKSAFHPAWVWIRIRQRSIRESNGFPWAAEKHSHWKQPDVRLPGTPRLIDEILSIRSPDKAELIGVELPDLPKTCPIRSYFEQPANAALPLGEDKPLAVRCNGRFRKIAGKTVAWKGDRLAGLSHPCWQRTSPFFWLHSHLLRQRSWRKQCGHPEKISANHVSILPKRRGSPAGSGINHRGDSSKSSFLGTKASNAEPSGFTPST